MKNYKEKLHLYNKKKLKIIFAGTPEFANIHFKNLIKKEYQIVGIITKPDKPSGRGMKVTISPVKKTAKQEKIKILQPENLFKKKIKKKIKKLKADIIIVIAYGFIIPKKILQLFPLGGINIHPSLLPKWQGPAPIQWSILKGDKKTGITIIQMNKFIDQGDIICSFSCKIYPKENYLSLYDKLSVIGSKAIIYILNKIINFKKIKFQKQKNKKKKYAKKIKKQDGKINWKNDKAKKIKRMIKAFINWPNVYFKIQNKIIKIWKVIIIKEKKKKYSPGKVIKSKKKEIKIQTKKHIIKIEIIQIQGFKKQLIKNIETNTIKWIKKKLDHN